MSEYILGIDQSTQGTKALLFDQEGTLLAREDISHRQIVNPAGWVSHNPMEIYHNVLQAIKNLVSKSGIRKSQIVCIGISNQRETSLVWDKKTGLPLDHAIVWQCARAAAVCEKLKKEGAAKFIQENTGLPLSPYFPAAKLAWFLENVPKLQKKAQKGQVCFGTMDTWLVYKLTQGNSYKTDYSNASRTQLFNLFTLQWDSEICQLFGVHPEQLPAICDSDSDFGETTLEGYLDAPIPIHAVLGDSHGALFGQGCLSKGMVKATYGTGSSIMMNIGAAPVSSSHGLVTSLAWKLKGKVSYVLEGNVNYTGAIISWLQHQAGLLASPEETEALCRQACQHDTLYFVPAFTGLGAPYWEPDLKAALLGIDRNTGKKEIVKAGVEAIAYQIADVISAMRQDTGIPVKLMRADGGPAQNTYLMQFQSSLLNAEIHVPDTKELSGMGAAYAAGFAMGLLPANLFEKKQFSMYRPASDTDRIKAKYEGWKRAVRILLSGKEEKRKKDNE